MMNIDNAYDDFLGAQAESAVRTISEYEERVHNSHVKFGRFTIPSFYKAHFVSPDQEKVLKHFTHIWRHSM